MRNAIKSMKKIREIQMETMRYVNRISEDNNLKTYLSGGTLLGAVRHKGFIPWDDDVDMMILRSDYQKLISYINQDVQSSYKALTYDSDPQYYYPFAKIVDTRTRIQEIGKVPIAEMGIGVDLFPIDNLPNNKKIISWHFWFERKLHIEFDNLYIVDSNNKGEACLYAWRRMLLRLISKLMNFFAMLHKSSNTERVAVSVWGYGIKEIVARFKMTQSIKVEFEGEFFWSPRGYHTYLSHLYGDYMTPPPKAKQHYEHNMKAYIED